ncbi:MAG: hypothetical protein HFK00_08795 [Oscillospiraceae bacterium]|nr:hypothetical protein [Oscillospiraceae bacterium]
MTCTDHQVIIGYNRRNAYKKQLSNEVYTINNSMSGTDFGTAIATEMISAIPITLVNNSTVRRIWV